MSRFTKWAQVEHREGERIIALIPAALVLLVLLPFLILVVCPKLDRQLHLGTLLAYLGVSVAAGTVTGIALVLMLGRLLVLYLKRVEETELAERFGEEYARYKRETPFMIPRRATRRDAS